MGWDGMGWEALRCNICDVQQTIDLRDRPKTERKRTKNAQIYVRWVAK